jgi:predicted amidophosphoribosyltransferase
MLRPVVESSSHEVVVKKQSQTRCPRCGAWSDADRCPQCGAHRTSAEIGVHPEKEMQDLER